ncbi:universal stress protein [Nocardia harenae]|uniref:universal stress protein n=1 Tax=Nocardia harenae TaxID=358707 RepID=UPI0008308E1A|nr:universal stress protein [Nocardia harenae]
MTRTSAVEKQLGRRAHAGSPHGPIVVGGVDGSSGLSGAAVDEAAVLAAATGALLVLVGAYELPCRDDNGRVADILKGDAYLIEGSTPTEEILRTAEERARALGARRVVRHVTSGSIVDALLAAVTETGAAVLVLADPDAGTRRGRWLGTISSELGRRTSIDLVVVAPEAEAPEHRPAAAVSERLRALRRDYADRIRSGSYCALPRA